MIKFLDLDFEADCVAARGHLEQSAVIAALTKTDGLYDEDFILPARHEWWRYNVTRDGCGCYDTGSKGKRGSFPVTVLELK